jgi:hypothetical protein
MPFSELELKRIEQAVGEFCRKQSPAQLQDKFRLEYRVKGHEIVIVECRGGIKVPGTISLPRSQEHRPALRQDRV